MLYSICSSSARSSFSGGIDGRPIVEYSRSNRGDSRCERRVGHLPNRPQRMVRSDARLRRDVAEHRVVARIVASHRHAPFQMVGSIVVRRDHRVDPFAVTFSAPC